MKEDYNTDKDYRTGYDAGFRYYMERKDYHKARAGVSHHLLRALDDLIKEFEEMEPKRHSYKAGWSQAIRVFKALNRKSR